MMEIVVMSYVLTVQQAFRNTTIKVKKYKDGTSILAVSLFRIGLSKLRRNALSLGEFGCNS